MLKYDDHKRNSVSTRYGVIGHGVKGHCYILNIMFIIRNNVGLKYQLIP